MEALEILPSARIAALVIYCLGRNGTNKNGWTSETARKIAEYVGVNRRHIFKLLDTLESHGVIVCTERSGNIVKRRINFSDQGRVESKSPDRWIARKRLVEEPVGNQVSLSKEEIEFGAFDLVDEFKSRWSKKYGTPCHFTGKDRGKAFSMIQSLGVDESLARMGRYLDDDNEWLKKRSHPFAAFCSMVNQYRSEDAEAKISQHEDFEREIRKFEERIACRQKGRDALAKRSGKKRRS